MPLASGKRVGLGAISAMQAGGGAAVMAEAAPQAIMAAGTPIISAIFWPALRCRLGTWTKCFEASTMAATTSGGMIDPPSTVTVPMPLITGFAPRSS